MQQAGGHPGITGSQAPGNCPGTIADDQGHSHVTLSSIQA
jgi:hypothetical protein